MKKISDKVHTEDLLKTTNMLSINQLNAQIKIMKIWKANNIKDYHLKLNNKEIVTGNISTRACTQGRLIEPGTKPIMQKTCILDAIRLWNKTPSVVTLATSLPSAKQASKDFVKTLPT